MLDVNSTEEELLAAWKFLKFMLSSDNTAAFASKPAVISRKKIRFELNVIRII